MKRLLLVVLSIFCSISVWCADGDTFTAKTVEGVDMTFTIISEEQKTCKVGYTYEKKKGIRIAIDKSTLGAITIPAIANGYNVKAIADDAFSSCSLITSIVVPDGVTSVGESAFFGCAKAETISIPNSVTGDSFGDRTFTSCESLTAINIPEGVNSIGPLAFYNCESLKSVAIPSTVTTIYEQAFSGCSSLGSITLPDNLKYIGFCALGGTCITSLTLPKSFTTSYGIDYLSYSGTTIGRINTLKTVCISKGVGSLKEVFKDCPYIEKIICYNEKPVYAANCWKSGIIPILYVPEGSKELYKADDYWKHLTITEMKNVTFVDANAKNICINKWDLDGDGEINQLELSEITDIEQTFRNHADITNFAEFKYFANLTSIGDNAFSGCSNLNSVTIPANVKSIGNSAFAGCNKLTSVYAESPEPSMLSFNSFPNRRNATLYVPAGSKSAYSSASFWQDFKSIEEIDMSSINIAFADSDVKAICVANANWDTNGDGELSMAEAAAITDLGTTFYNKKSIRKFNELQYFTGLSALGNSAFCECNYLESIVLPQTITSIGSYAFANCRSLTSITVPDKVENIEKQAFSYCSGLNSIILGNGVKNIGENAFLCNSSLTDFYCYANEVPTTHNTAFENSNISSSTLYVPSGAIDAYKSNSPWSDFMTTNPIPMEVEIAINETNFPDAFFRDYLIAQSYGSDGVITDEEIATIKIMEVASRNISNLKGINYFTAITKLTCQNNNLTTLDLSMNTALTEINCSMNRLTTLDVSNNTELITLNCQGNQLTSLDVSKNTTLKTINCYSNQINGEEMDVLVESLPNTENGMLFIIINENEGNAMTSTQVAAAKSKGWIPKYFDGSDWLGYEGIVGVVINETNFPDENFRNYLKSQSYGRDGVITDNEIGGNGLIAVDELKITNLKGIEYFTELRWLSCPNNQLTSLDLSKNTELEMLWCNNNLLTSLDVSKNTKLIYLVCSDNQLTSLDVSKNTLLTGLYCVDNQITSLDVSKNIDLRSLNCNNNQLTALDVSKNTKLGSLDCSDNQFTSLDVSNNTALTYLGCNNNQLSTLDVSNNTALTRLECGINQLTSIDLSKNTALTRLFCHQNKLASLDVSNNTKLTRLFCQENQLTSLDVSKHTALTMLFCYSNQIKDEAMDVLITGLPTVKKGVLAAASNENEGNVLTTVQAAAAEAKGWTLQQIDNNNWKEWGDMPEFGIEINETNFPDERFRHYLKDQSYGIDGVLTDAEIASITSMNVNRQNISDLKGIEIFSALTSLSCSNNQLTSLDISKNTELTILWCNYNQLTSLDISKNTLLTELYCYDNQITSLDVSKNTALTRLGCDNNQLSSLDVSKNTKLTFLYCGNRQLTSLDVSNNTALETLYCNDSQLTSLDVSKNTELTKLYCQQNRLTSLDVSKNTVLSLLYCYNNQIKDKAMDALVASLPNANNGILQIINNENEGNVMTTIQVADARVKGWIPMCNDGSNWVEYAGRTSGVIEINETNFPDANFRNYLATQTYGKDGVITEEESSLITSINVEGLQISNLKGIEYFAGLSILSCNNNQLTSLDVSNNTALTILDCNNNQLTSLDVSKNTKLMEVWCYYNQLSSLDVTKNTVLTVLGCFCNQLTSLDVSKNTALTRLHCNVNQLTSLDVSNNTALTNLECGTNQLTSLDVSNNTALIELVCNNNQLTSLDVSKNTALIMLFCYSNQLALLDVSKNTALTMLRCHYNQLTSLDVSKNTTLTRLDCDNNQLTTLDVSKNTALQVFWCSNNLLTSLDVSKNIVLNTLYCYGNQIKGEAMDALVSGLPIVENGGLYIMFYENEGNVMTTIQVAAAKAKGWIPMYGNGNNYTEYAGSMPKFKLTYMVDGVEYKSSEVEYGSAITPEAYPEKDTYKFSGWSEIPETMPANDVTITGSFERYFTIGNVVKLVNFTINGNATATEVGLYDLNTDGELNIGDIILVVKWILNNNNDSHSSYRTRSYDSPDLAQYTAAQFDIKTTTDTNIREIRLVKGMEQTHQMMYQQKDANTYSVVVYSLSNQLMKPENEGIVEINTDNNNLNGVSIENVIVALPTGETQSYSGMSLSTNIQQIEWDEGPAVVYDLKGNRQKGTKGLKKGVYIVNGKKVIVK